MSDAAYFSAFSEPPLGAHARRLRSIDREGEEGGEREEVERDGKGKFYYTSGRNPFSYTVSRIL